MLQGVVARGTARAISALSPYVAGKTGTTEDSVDGWFIGFTNDVTIAVWVGYDNGDGKRRSLGSAETGAKVALPIFEPIVNAVWSKNIAPKAPLSGPSSLAQSQLIDLAIDFKSGDRMKRGRGFIEHSELVLTAKSTIPSTRYCIFQHPPPFNEQTFLQNNHPQNRPFIAPGISILAIQAADGTAQGDTNWSWGWQQPVSFGPFLRW